MAKETVREIVSKHQDKILNNVDNLPPAELERIGLELAVLLTNINDEVARLEAECIRFKRDELLKHENIKMSNVMADTMMMAEPIYEEMKKTKGLISSVEEIIRLIKFRLKRLEYEYKSIR